MHTPLVNPIIDLKRPSEKIQNGEYIAIKCHYNPGDNDSGSYEINLPYYGGVSPEEWLVWNDKLLKTFDGRSTSTGTQRYTVTVHLLTGDAKPLDISIHTVDNFNKVPAEMTKHAFPAYAFCKQRSMNVGTSLNQVAWNYVVSSVGLEI